jgi:hypothetical protein
VSRSIGNDWDNITVGDTEHLYKTNGVQSYWCPQLDNTTWSWDPISTCTEAYQFSPMSLEGTGEMYVMLLFSFMPQRN